MISQLANNVISQTQQYDNLRVIASQSDAIQAVTSLLAEVNTDLAKWAAIYPCIEPLLSLDEAQSIRQEAAALRRDLAKSHSEFEAQQVQQGGKLTQLKGKVEKLRNQTKDAWQNYTKNAVAPYLELSPIAEHLDTTGTRHEEVSGHLQITQRLSSDLPTKPENVDKFHTSLRRLQTLLSDLEGLPSDVRAFLDSLMRGRATMAQVTPGVFEWCRTHGVSDKLRITW